jgi:hypothetical protein
VEDYFSQKDIREHGKRSVFEPTQDVATGGRRKWQNEQFNNLDYLTDIIRMIKLKRVEWPPNVECVVILNSSNKYLVLIACGKKHFVVLRLGIRAILSYI